MKTLQSAVERLLFNKYKVSSHYVISRTGKILQLVKDNNIAWHAGISNWFNFKNLNNNSIGIELENKGHQHGYQNFTNKQINQLIKLLRVLKKNLRFKILILLAIQISRQIEKKILEKSFLGINFIKII